MVYVHKGLIELERIPVSGRFDSSFEANLEQLVSMIRPCLACDADGNPRPKQQLVQVLIFTQSLCLLETHAAPLEICFIRIC